MKPIYSSFAEALRLFFLALYLYPGQVFSFTRLKAGPCDHVLLFSLFFLVIKKSIFFFMGQAHILIACFFMTSCQKEYLSQNRLSHSC